ncbi:MAG: hypothetical protein IPK13_01665 [Deltaproteobacteria bacterium]|nr:hypothetical protein [Deltaproteobacteria bacterium]
MGTITLGDIALTAGDEFRVQSAILRGADVDMGIVDGRPAVFCPTVSITRTGSPLRNNSELMLLVDASVDLLKNRSGFVQVSRDPTTTSSGAPAILQHHRFKQEDQIEIEQQQLFVLPRSGAEALILTATGLPGQRWAARRDGLRRVLLSIAEAHT